MRTTAGDEDLIFDSEQAQGEQLSCQPGWMRSTGASHRLRWLAESRIVTGKTPLLKCDARCLCSAQLRSRVLI